jgi:hypothetical protein
MNMFPSFTTLRSFISYQYEVLRMRALRDQFLAKLSGTSLELSVFPKSDQRLSPSRKLIGIEIIRVDQIIGTLNRNTDFDRRFRPLKKHNLERWINAYLLHEQDGWSPITVHKVGEQYFVEDGHHRVSVAHMLGVDFMEAKVWEHDTQGKNASTNQCATCAEKILAKTLVTN